MLTHWETHQANKNQLLILYIKENMMLVYSKELSNLKRLQRCQAPSKLGGLSTDGIWGSRGWGSRGLMDRALDL